jgi:chemotaxis protein CheC
MLDKKIDMAVPRVKILNFKDIPDILGNEEILIAGILLEVTGDIKGNILFVLDINSAHTLVNILVGKQDAVEKIGEFDDIEVSALKEIGNILAGSYLSALSMLTSKNIMPSVPDLCLDMAGAILSVPAIGFGKVGNSVLYIETEFIQGKEKVLGDFFLVPDSESYVRLLNTLGAMC